MERRLDIVLELAGPVLTRSTAPAGFGVDAPVARDAEGRPVLPASLVKGKLREAWGELAEISSQDSSRTEGSSERDFDRALPRWLGKGNEEEAWHPDRGGLILGDLVWRERPPANGHDEAPPAGEQESDQAGSELGDEVISATGGSLRYRICIDDQLGAVKPQFLQVVESPFAAGETVCFEGSAYFVPQPKEEPEAVRWMVERGLRWVTSFGALRTLGFGRVLNAAVTLADADEAATPEQPELSGTFLGLELMVDEALMINDPQPVGNLFRSLGEIPGSVLKGALASTWNELLGRTLNKPIEAGCDPAREELARNFDALRFTHAFPSMRAQGHFVRPVTAPLSLAKAGKEQPFFDLLLKEPLLLFDEELGAHVAPSFEPDWKERGDVDAALGWPKLRRELRVRTAIDGASRRAADEKLFAYELVRPEEGRAWVARVDLSRVPKEERGAASAQLQDLLSQGLRHLGKTQARGKAKLVASAQLPDAVTRRERKAESRLRAVVLQTPAVLVDQQILRPGVDLRADYETVWRQLLTDPDGSEDSGDSAGLAEEIDLVRFFAAQDLAGGRYLHRRFQSERPYRPFVLTRAGSVFLLRLPEDPEARQKLSARLDGLAKTGLPLPRWARTAYERKELGLPGDHWRCCPYIPENGFGEIAVDLELHWQERPERFEPVSSAEKLAQAQSSSAGES